jgi:hypothetical protein
MKDVAFARSAAVEGSRAGSSAGSEPSSDGLFANGVSVAAVVQFILDHEQAAPIDDVAAWFGLDVEGVSAALRYYSLHGDRLRASGAVVVE